MSFFPEMLLTIGNLHPHHLPPRGLLPGPAVCWANLSVLPRKYNCKVTSRILPEMQEFMTLGTVTSQYWVGRCQGNRARRGPPPHLPPVGGAGSGLASMVKDPSFLGGWGVGRALMRFWLPPSSPNFLSCCLKLGPLPRVKNQYETRALFCRIACGNLNPVK